MKGETHVFIESGFIPHHDVNAFIAEKLSHAQTHLPWPSRAISVHHSMMPAERGGMLFIAVTIILEVL